MGTLESNDRAVKTFLSLPDSFDSDRVVSPKDAAALLGISLPTLHRMWQQGAGPRRRQISPRRIGVRLRDLKAYLDSAAV
jgi:predicted DNA-binding transcriptional regulator AlpA